MPVSGESTAPTPQSHLSLAQGIQPAGQLRPLRTAALSPSRPSTGKRRKSTSAAYGFSVPLIQLLLPNKSFKNPRVWSLVRHCPLENYVPPCPALAAAQAARQTPVRRKARRANAAPHAPPPRPRGKQQSGSFGSAPKRSI